MVKKTSKQTGKKWWISIEPNGGVSQFPRAMTRDQILDTWGNLSFAYVVFGFSRKPIAEAAAAELLNAPLEQARDYATDLLNQPMVCHVVREQFPIHWLELGSTKPARSRKSK